MPRSLSDTAKLQISQRCPTCGQRLVHPGWNALCFIVACGLLTFLLYQNATNFDQTELRVLAWFAGLVAAMKFGLGPQLLVLAERWLGAKK